MFFKRRKGFTLTEVALALGIASIVGFIAFTQMIKQEEINKASLAGDQIKLIGSSVNAYISNHYDSLSSLTSSTNTSSDLGPRTCTSGSNSCTITAQTLVNEGLLPSTYSGKNVYGSDYNIVIKRNGTSPYYKVNAMITTSSPLVIGSSIRYDLLGKAMQSAGIDSGMTRNNATKVSGYNGSWTASATDYSNINDSGLLAYQAGYGTYNYSVFLRRDGTLPMTGALNMGSQDINNANNITASGSGSLGGSLALNGLSNTDFPSGWKGGLRTNNVVAGGTIAAGNSASTINAYMNNLGQIYGSSKIDSGGTISATGTITAGNWVWAKNGYGDTIGLGGDNAGSDYEIRLSTARPLTIYSPNSASNTTVLQVGGNTVVNGRLSTNNLDPNNLPSGWGGGVRTYDLYASGTVGAGDNNGNLRAYLNSSGVIYASSNLQADGNITSSSQIIANGRLTTNEYLQINGQATLGAGCSPNGLQGRDSSGGLLSCINGVWKTALSINPVFSAEAYDNQVVNLGSYNYCALSKMFIDDVDKHQTSCEVTKSGSNWFVTAYNDGNHYVRCKAVCF